jgi:hypothetical protein
MDNRAGNLTVYSADRAAIYGEFAEATWRQENVAGVTNHLFVGTASEGTIDAFLRINEEGITHVAYDFESSGEKFSGNAQLLMPEDLREPGHARVRIETGDEPTRA